MAENPVPATSGPAPQGPRTSTNLSRQTTAYLLFGAGAVLTGLAVWVFWMAKVEARHFECVWTACWLIVLAAVCEAGGLVQLLTARRGGTDSDASNRLMVLVMGGVAGLATLALAGALTYHWWTTIGGGLQTWRKEWWRLGTIALALFGGLGVMFASLQAVRSQERTNAWMRRLLYGYNTVLTGVLLLAILGIVNVLGYVHAKPFTVLSTPTDWTAATLYSLSDASRNLLASIKQPVKIYVLMGGRGGLARQEVETLLANCRAVNDRIEAEYISPDENPERVENLVRDYSLTESKGLLVVYGSKPHETHEFVKMDDMFDQGSDKNAFRFSGESALMAKLRILVEGKNKPVVYFTQGNGELDLNDTTGNRLGKGMGQLKERLTKGNYDVRDLHLDPAHPNVPDDAAVVVVARPTSPGMNLDALKEYMDPKDPKKKKGKLIVLEDVTIGPDKKMVHTGLEEFLARFNVEVKDDRLLYFGRAPSPTQFYVSVDRAAMDTNPIVSAFAQYAWPWINGRTVEPKSQPAPGSPYQATTLLVARGPILSETNFRDDPLEIRSAYLTPEHIEELRKRLKEEIPVAVAVSTPSGAPMDPHSRMGPQEPRLVVFGSSSWVSNALMDPQTQAGSIGYDLFSSTLSWLRDRPEIGKTAEAKERRAYAPHLSEEAQKQLLWVPLSVLLVGIVGMGGGLWVVRRS